MCAHVVCRCKYDVCYTQHLWKVLMQCCVFFRSKVDLWKGLSNEFSVQFSVSVNDAQEYSD